MNSRKAKCHLSATFSYKEHLGKFDARNDEGMFLGYSENSSAFRVYNTRSLMIMESVNVVFDDVAAVQWEKDEEQVKIAPSDTSNHPSTESVVDAPSVSEVT